ncbi:MAG: response regulator [Planctomycetaceae bacterium]
MMHSEPVIYVVDDDPDSRESAVALISQMSLKAVSYSSAIEFLDAYDGYRPACLLTDHRMLGMTGVELLETLRGRGITLSVVVMTAFAETELTVRAIRGGAVTLLEKPFSNTALWNAIHEALSEDRDIATGEERIQAIRQRLETLTPGEVEVMNLIVEGETNKAAAFRLGVSVRTVENRRSNIFEKMDVVSLAELVQLVIAAR